MASLAALIALYFALVLIGPFSLSIANKLSYSKISYVNQVPSLQYWASYHFLVLTLTLIANPSLQFRASRLAVL